MRFKFNKVHFQSCPKKYCIRVATDQGNQGKIREFEMAKINQGIWKFSAKIRELSGKSKMGQGNQGVFLRKSYKKILFYIHQKCLKIFALAALALDCLFLSCVNFLFCCVGSISNIMTWE